MAAVSPVEEVKARVDLADLIGSTLALQRSGRSYRALCPFHAEKTPSFYVFPETQTWKCFGCGVGGDAFSYVMQRDNLDFGDALRELAARAGVTLESRADPVQQEAYERLYRINETAALYFHAMLMQQAAGQAARRYLEGRGITTETCERFVLGYAPDSNTALQDHLRAAGFAPEDVLAAGLVIERDEPEAPPRDRFRQRLMFPIRDTQGRTVGFGGRILLPDGVPKYLNTAQTAIFEKGTLLYALDQAREAIRAERRVVIVEGYVDAVMAHQAGFRNVVAALGTALGPRQLSPLGRIADEIVFALDPDAAGDNATLRSLIVAREALGATVPVPTRRGIRYQTAARTSLRVAQLPDGQDPDELIRGAPERWRALIAAALPVLDFLFERLPYQYDLSSPQGKTAAVEELLPALRDLSDRIEQAHYAQRLAAVVGLPEATIAELARPTTRRAAPLPPPRLMSPDRLEEYALALLALGATSTMLAESDFARPECRALYRWLQAGGMARDGGTVPPELTISWQTVQEQVARTREQPPDRLRVELDNTTLELRKRRLTREQEELQSLARDSEGMTERQCAERMKLLMVQRAELERAQAAHGRVVASPPRFQGVREGSRD